MSFTEISEWLEKQGSKLLDEPNNNFYGITRKIKYMCAKCKNTAEKQIQSIRKTGAFCSKCCKQIGIEKTKKTVETKKLNEKPEIVKEAKQVKKRKRQDGITVKFIRELLLEKYGATLITTLSDTDTIRIKEKIEFGCKCGEKTSKALRDANGSRDGGAFCKNCQSKHKSNVISSKQGDFMFNMVTLTKLLNEYNAKLIRVVSGKTDKLDYNEQIEYECICGEQNVKTFQAIRIYGALCEICIKPETTFINNVLDQLTCKECDQIKGKNEFLFMQTTWKQQMSEYCKTCREERCKRQNALAKERKCLEFESNNTHKKCAKCYKIKEIDDFGSDTMCLVCYNASKKSNGKLKENVALARTMYPDLILCMKCFNLKDKNDFITECNKIEGRCCSDCRNYVFKRNDEIAYKILELKKEMGKNGCADCGEKDIRLLEFDHIDRLTKTCDIWRCRTIEHVKNESNKCVMRCIICHVRRTKKQLGYGKTKKVGKSYVDEHKMKIGGCEICGWFDPDLLEALHFDHINREEKNDTVSSLATKNNIRKIDHEMKQLCRLICAHCHKLHTIEQLGYILYSGNDRMDERRKKTKII